MKRIFIAIKVNAEPALLNMISAFRLGLTESTVKWTPVDDIHITLAFPGDTEDSMIAKISDLLLPACKGFGSFSLVLKGAGVFRNLSDPRIIWTGIDHSEKLASLNSLVTSELTSLAIRLDKKPFSPHITFGRIKQLHDSGVLQSLIRKFNGSELQTVEVREVILFESRLFQTGPVYKPLATFPL